MLRYSPLQRLRQLARHIPGATKLYDLLRLLFAATYREDGLVTTHNCDFVRAPEFVAAYQRAEGQQKMGAIRWRAHVTQWAGFHAQQLEGDFVECGVNRGFLSMSVMTYVNFTRLTDRKFYLFDTYSGLVPELVSAADTAAYRNDYEECYEFVKQSFADFPNVIIVRGPVPDTLAGVSIRKVAYLSIDMNCTQPEIDALEYFWPLVVSGGLIILDDYGFPGHESQKAGADNFATNVGAKILTLPTGQGLLIKP